MMAYENPRLGRRTPKNCIIVKVIQLRRLGRLKINAWFAAQHRVDDHLFRSLSA
jgi:hypothetical protein